MSTTLGHETLKVRIESIPGHLQSILRAPPPQVKALKQAPSVVTTGLGSSEATARYLTSLLNRSGTVRSEFLPHSVFYGELPSYENRPHIVLFSQGLSPNTEIVLAQRHHFSGLTLVTASTPEGQEKAGKPKRAQILRDLIAEDNTIVRHPIENEYEILPRVVGPICAELTCLRIASEVLSPSMLPLPDESTLISACRGPFLLPDELDAWATELLEGVDFFFTNRESTYAQNLAAKILETIFRPLPRLYDAFHYSHGPFQVDRSLGGRKWIFAGPEKSAIDLVKRLTPLFQRTGPTRVIQSPLPEPYALFYYEQFLNTVVLRAAEIAQVDLINWPGKGEDGEGYSLSQPYMAPNKMPL
ncbi:hypothetical protein [Rubellicoccus peritrichatus]|uniref:SIS domain-containing protein n=1 Tax=Rubellicoccus peritrichatus TaxID=3080537 RepID=A0AAQ3QVA1_9BACT|nr:hypothetical protein [Puniceicoccus sp. CR14]WOO40652.1 hypothetical protein RZN69_18680 [Puniceicoccus sp. CR14]